MKRESLKSEQWATDMLEATAAASPELRFPHPDEVVSWDPLNEWAVAVLKDCTLFSHLTIMFYFFFLFLSFDPFLLSPSLWIFVSSPIFAGLFAYCILVWLFAGHILFLVEISPRRRFWPSAMEPTDWFDQ